VEANFSINSLQIAAIGIQHSAVWWQADSRSLRQNHSCVFERDHGVRDHLMWGLCNGECFMKSHLRSRIAGSFAAGLLISVSLFSSTALAEARQVGGDKATWDKACQSNANCMPVGDLGGGINGYFVHDGNGGGTSVWCDDNNCVADRRPIKPAKDAVQILQQPVSKVGGQPAQGNESPAMLLNMR
jgi:hypothetical protein